MDDYTTRFEMLKAQTQVPDLVPSSIVNISMKTNKESHRVQGM